MKRKGPTFGHVKFEYRLDAVFRRAIKEFREADAISEAAEKEYKVGKEAPELLPKYFSAQQRKMETGVVVIMAAGALLEQVINDYAHTFLDSDYRMRQTSKNMSEKTWVPKELDKLLLKNLVKTTKGQADVRRSNWRALYQSKMDDERKTRNTV
jgi:hypothetical protein